MYSNNSGDGVLDGKILTVIYSIGLHVMFNRYALENIVLGIIRPGDKIPYEEYLDAFGMRDQEQYMIRGAICGNVIDQDEKIIVQPLEKYFRQFFIQRYGSIHMPINLVPTKYRRSRSKSRLLTIVQGLCYNLIAK